MEMGGPDMTEGEGGSLMIGNQRKRRARAPVICVDFAVLMYD